MTKSLWVIVCSLALCSCSGELTTRFLARDNNSKVASLTSDDDPDAQFKADAKRGIFHGVVAYPMAWFTVWSKSTQQIKDGKVIANASGTGGVGKCTPIETVQIQAHADTAHPMLISYKPGLLESYKLTVALSTEGALQSVNTESTPDKGETIKNLGDTYKSLFPAAVAPGACNDGVVVYMMKPYRPGDEVRP